MTYLPAIKMNLNDKFQNLLKINQDRKVHEFKYCMFIQNDVREILFHYIDTGFPRYSRGLRSRKISNRE
jgi:hypothetical protein